jgi:hypothetical protein
MSEKKTKHLAEESKVTWGSTVLFMFFVFFLFNFWQLIHEKYFVTEVVGQSGAVISKDYNVGLIAIVLGVMALIVVVLIFVFKHRIWQFVTSMKLGISLMSAITLGTIIGTLVFQNAAAQDYVAYYSKIMFDIFDRLHFIDVFDAWWFLAYEVLLGIVLVCVTLKRKFWLPEKLGAANHTLWYCSGDHRSLLRCCPQWKMPCSILVRVRKTEVAVRADFLDKFRDIPGYMDKLQGRNDIKDAYDLIKTENLSLIPEEYLIPLGGKFKLNDFEELYYDEPYVIGQSQWTTRTDIRTGQDEQVTRSAMQIEYDSKKPVVLKDGFGKLRILKTYKNYQLKKNLINGEGGKPMALVSVGNAKSGPSAVSLSEESLSLPLKGYGDRMEEMSHGMTSSAGSAFTLRFASAEPDAENP